jgi:hypothetical protein
MATTTQHPPAGPQAVLPGKKPGPGRPPKPETVAAKARTEALVGAVAEDGSFWEWVDAVEPDDWQWLIIYAWRIEPVIDLAGGGKPISIDKFTTHFDLKTILEVHGSGEYRFDVSVIPKDGARQKRIRQFYVPILDQRYPPRIALGAWIDHPRNERWKWAKAALQEEAANAAAQPQQSNGIVDTLELFTKLQEISGGKADSSMTAVVLQMLQSNQEALRNYQDPTKQFTTLKGLMDMAGGGKQQDSGMGMVLEIMRDELRATRAELAALRAQPPVNPVAQLKETLGVLQDLGMSVPGGGNGKAAGTGVTEAIVDVAGRVIDKLGDAVPAIVTAYQFGKQKEAEIAHINANAPKNRPWEFGEGKPAPTAVVPQPATPQGPAPPQTPMEQGPMTAQRLFTKYALLIQQIGPILVDHFQNSDGAAFQDWFIHRKGADTFNAFRADATPELLTEAVTSHPQLKLIFQPEDKVLNFFADLLAEPEEDEDDGDEEDAGTLSRAVEPR